MHSVKDIQAQIEALRVELKQTEKRALEIERQISALLDKGRNMVLEQYGVVLGDTLAITAAVQPVLVNVGIEPEDREILAERYALDSPHRLDSVTAEGDTFTIETRRQWWRMGIPIEYLPAMRARALELAQGGNHD